MKYIVILGDGMADYPVKELGNRTPLEVAEKPNIDMLAQKGFCGLAKSIPDGLPPGSDTANLSVMGYDPRVYYTGRSPLEAVSMGISLSLTDVTYRCNIVTLSDEDEYEDCVMQDYSCDEIPTVESEVLIRELDEVFRRDGMKLYAGISYRHCLVLKNAKDGCDATPPHDILDKCVREFLPKGQNSGLLLELMRRSKEFLKNHPINQERIKRGLKPASSLWFWGEGRKPDLDTFQNKYHVNGAVVSAVDLIKGIGICAGMESIEVEGATGNIHTNFIGKGVAAIEALKNGKDFVYIHIEAPDECGHRREIENKVLAIEKIDKDIVGPVVKAMEETGEPFRIMVLPDHPTPLDLRTHVRDPIPFIIYDSRKSAEKTISSYTEKQGAETGVLIDPGHTLMGMFLSGK